MVSCVFNGRLGNNLFQIANVISISTKLDTDFLIPEYTHCGHRGTRPVDLSLFNHPFKRGKFISKHNLGESQFKYKPIEIVNDMNISGFYQSWKYFEDIREELLGKYFAPSETVIKSLTKYDVLPINTLGISVRRGDYLMLQNNHCVLPATYYQEVIDKYFMDKTIEAIYIFSDDIEWCKTIFGDTVNYVQDDIGTQLFLMGRMKHFIMSNSTFAWWGMYLSQRTDGLVIAPDPWFGPDLKDTYTNDLYYPTWIKHEHTPVFEPFQMTDKFFD